jgi:glutamate racemase
MNKKAIGMFDSGIGGLTVYRAIKEKIPRERIIYLGDTARLPYGSKSAETIIRFSEENARFLLEKNIKIIVVACNSSSAHALPRLQDLFSIPIVGVIEAGAEAAAKCAKKRIGVIGTAATIRSRAYENAILEKKGTLEILSRDCPLLVPLVEEGWVEHRITRLVVEEYLLPLKDQGIDTLVLGCTHYPVLKNVIAQVLGPQIQLIDSAMTTADRVLRMLRNMGWLNPADEIADDEFHVTDFPERFRKVGEIFLGRKIENVEVAGPLGRI